MTRSTRLGAIVAACVVALLGCNSRADAAPSGNSTDAGVSSAGAPMRPWLDVTLPPAPAPSAQTAKAVLGLHDQAGQPDFAGLRIRIGDGAPRLVPTGTSVELTVRASNREPLRLEIGGAEVLAHLRPGDSLQLYEGHDGGWAAMIGNRTPEDAPKSLTVCAKRMSECPTGYLWTYAYEGDAVCPVPSRDNSAHKCVKAPVVRARGPVGERTEVRLATASGRFDDLQALSLSPRPLAAKTVGPWIPVQIGREFVPRVSIGDAAAVLILGPGDACEVWLQNGRIDSQLVTQK